MVYEYVQNGSLNDHLHDPLIKGIMNVPLALIHYDAWIRQGHAIDATGTRILHIKSEVSDTI